jgi:hypothetical protein
MIGIIQGTPVVLAASVARDVLVIHPSIVVARFLTDLHSRLVRLDDGR